MLSDCRDSIPDKTFAEYLASNVGEKESITLTRNIAFAIFVYHYLEHYKPDLIKHYQK